MLSHSPIDNHLTTARQLLERLERDGAAYAESLRHAHDALAQSLAVISGTDERRATLSQQTALGNSDLNTGSGPRTTVETPFDDRKRTTGTEEAEDLKERNGGFKSLERPVALIAPLPEQEYMETDLHAFLERYGYHPWAEELLGSFSARGGKPEDIIHSWKSHSGILIAGLDMIHDYDKIGSKCSALAAGAWDKDFWDYATVAHGLPKKNYDVLI